MHKQEFIDLVVARTGLTKKDSEQTMNAIFEVMGELLSKGDRLMVNGFGTFDTKERPARTARNPRTGKTMQVPAARAAVFRASQTLKKKLNQK